MFDVYASSRLSLTRVVVQTFIRNATGKALTDSPALNQLSRQVLVPITRPNLHAPAIVVPGPGPMEPAQAGTATGNLLDTDEPPLPANGSSGDLMGTNASQDPPSNEGEGDDDEGVLSAPASANPYAGLDSAFGGYLADQPRPQNKDLLDMI